MGDHLWSHPERISRSSRGFAMHKLILIALLGCALIALTGASEQESESSLQKIEADVSLLREAREAEARRKGNADKKNKKKRNGKKSKKLRKKKGKKAKKNKKKGKKAKKNK